MMWLQKAKWSSLLQLLLWFQAAFAFEREAHVQVDSAVQQALQYLSSTAAAAAGAIAAVPDDVSAQPALAAAQFAAAAQVRP
jgi:hypothetical protein